MQIIPAILPKDFDEIIDKLNALEYLVPRVQIDLCDGEFGLLRTWLPEGGEELPSDYEYEFDIMVNDWRPYVMRAVDMGASRVVAHVDNFSEADATELIEMLEHTGTALGVCVSNNVPIDVHSNFVKFFQERYDNVFIQVMGIRDIGAQGQPFDESVLSRIETLREECEGVEIQVDGAMNNKTGELVHDVGAIAVIAGSYVFGSSDIAGAIEEIETI
jgi:ribulose-phosphate 3-epimerase